MLNIGTELFVRIPEDFEQRILHPAKVTAIENDLYSFEFEESDLDLPPKTEIVVYYEVEQEFLQQTARIEMISPDPEADVGPIIGVSITGEPVSAESRHCFRVSTALDNLEADIATEQRCKLMDVSPTGFAVAADGAYGIGNVINAVLRHEGKRYKGRVCVQSIKALRTGKVRYGFYCIDDHGPNSNLPQGLQKIRATMQREQLRRLAAG